MISKVFHNSAQITLKTSYGAFDDDWAEYILNYWGSGDTEPFIQGLNQVKGEVYIIVSFDRPLEKLAMDLKDLKDGLGLEPKEDFIWFIN